MKLNFTKMHGLGNDFIVINALNEPFNLSHEQIKQLGHRKTGIGFDQLLIVEKADQNDVDFNYRIFNTDGSEVEHCGNGARCFAKYVIDNQLTDKKKLTVKIKKGIIIVDYISSDEIIVDMGKAILSPSEIPFIFNGEVQKLYPLTLEDKTINASVLSMGNPHVVIQIENLWLQEINKTGAAIQKLSCFPQSVNVNLTEIVNKNLILLRTYERGVGETDACGTGACATVYALNQLGLVGDLVTVQLRNGKLLIGVDKTGNITMSGPARKSFSGNIKL